MSEWIYDWNDTPSAGAVQVQDATLAEASRDPRVGPLGYEDARALVERALRVEVDSVDFGWILDGRGLDQLRSHLQGFRGRAAACSVRAEPNLLKPLAQCSRDSNVPLEVVVSAPRKASERALNLDASLYCCRRAVELGLHPVLTLVGAEQMEPWRLARVLADAADVGCLGVHIFDAGEMSVAGVGHVVRFARQHLDGLPLANRPMVTWSGSDWHGLALAKALEAVEAGAHRIRASILGLGQNGYTPLDLLLVNLSLQKRWFEPLSELARYVELVSHRLGYSVPPEYPVFGADAFRSACGSLAQAVAQAPAPAAAEQVYSAFPAHWLGARASIEIGPHSQASNVVQWLRQRGRWEGETRLVDRILAEARRRDHVLTELEILDLVTAA